LFDAGNVISLGLFLSPLPTFVTICKKKSVEQYSPMPYLAFLFNCMMWVLYGIPWVHPHSILVITINGSGLVIQLIYVLLFIAYSTGQKRLQVIVMLLVEVAYVVAVGVLVLTLAHTYDRRSLIVGSMCVFFGTMMYVAPLSVMKLVIKTKSVEYMPLTLSLASFLNGLCWTSYAVIRFDLYVCVQYYIDRRGFGLQIPNGLGVLFSTAQLILYGVYYKSTQRLLEERKRKAETGMTAVVVPDENGLRPPPRPEIRESI
ncbi:hypothetical protein Taro_016290, partial [Colocasia esculenta]|nr:hypothetical protein [Colocasia esculenta]